MANSTTKGNDQGQSSSLPALTLLIGGFACFVAWPFLLFFGQARYGSVYPSLDLSGFLFPLALAVALAVIAASLQLSWSRRLSALRGSYVVLAAMALAALAIPLYGWLCWMGGGVPWLASVAGGILGGLSFSTMLLFWGGAWVSFAEEHGADDLPLAAIVSFGAAVFVCVGLSQMMFEISLAASAVLPLLSLASYLALVRIGVERPESSPAGFERVVRMPINQAAYLVCIMAYVSFAVAFCVDSVGVFGAEATVASAMLLACAAHAVVRAIRGGFPSFLIVERIAFPVALAGALASPFSGHPAAAVVLCFAAALGGSFFIISHWVLLVKWAWRFKLQPVYHFAYGTVTVVGGMLLGLLANAAIRLSGDLADTLFLLVCLATLLAFVVTSAFASYGSEKVLGDFEGGVVSVIDQKGVWKSTLNGLARKHSLTPRESEILLFLAKGRNVKFISTKLVISEHTVKTHVYHIYRKLEISGLQELIDLVDCELENARRLAKL